MDRFDKAIALAIARSAHDNLGVDIDLNKEYGFEEFAVALFSESDVRRVQAFEEDLRAAGISWDTTIPSKLRPMMEYRVYEVPAEFVRAICDDEPSVGMNLHSTGQPAVPVTSSGESLLQSARFSNSTPLPPVSNPEGKSRSPGPSDSSDG